MHFILGNEIMDLSVLECKKINFSLDYDYEVYISKNNYCHLFGKLYITPLSMLMLFHYCSHVNLDEK